VPRPAPANALQALSPAPPARTWIALAALAVLASLGVAWSLSGTVPVVALGDGTVVRGDVPVRVTSPSQGRVLKVHRAVGEGIAAGELIAEIDAPRLRLQLTEAQGLLTALQQSDRNLRAEEQQAIASLAASVARSDGTAPMPESQALDRLDDLLAARAARAAEIERVAATVRRLVQEQDEQSSVRAPVAGTVVSIDAAEGAAVERGTRLAQVAPTPADGRMRCMATMRDAEPGRIAQGMRVRLSPEGTRPEIHGFAVGVVERVIAGVDSDAPWMVVILVDADAAAPSGVSWVGGRGLPGTMAPVSSAEISITVDEVAPITLAMPWLARQ
jgi:multidrug resistance efflux pump